MHNGQDIQSYGSHSNCSWGFIWTTVPWILSVMPEISPSSQGFAGKFNTDFHNEGMNFLMFNYNKQMQVYNFYC